MMPFRVKMEFNLEGRDLERVRVKLGRTNVTVEDIEAFLHKEYVEEVGNGTDRNMEITVTEVLQ